MVPSNEGTLSGTNISDTGGLILEEVDFDCRDCRAWYHVERNNTHENVWLVLKANYKPLY